MSDWTETHVTSSNGASIQTLCRLGDPAKLAFIAHPLGRLGGSFDDHVVRALARHLSERHSYSIILMNSRGVGASSGSPSFSGRLEAEDYQSVVEHYTSRHTDHTEVLLCGYSAGSLSASACPPRPPPSRTRYVLISYPLSVLWALTLFRSSYFTDMLRLRVLEGPLLSIRGTQDQFTADSKYKAWEERLDARGTTGKSASFVAVDGADHFWGDANQKLELLKAVDQWLGQM